MSHSAINRFFGGQPSTKYSPEDELILALRRVVEQGSIPQTHFGEICHAIFNWSNLGDGYRDILGSHMITLGQRSIAMNLREQVIADDSFLILDIGANTGEFTQRMLESQFQGHLISFEPIPELYEKIKSTYGQHDQLTVESLALGDEDTTSQINIFESETGLSSLLDLDPEYHYFNSDFDQDRQKQVEIQVAKLDTYFQGNPILDQYENVALKIDTQGYEKKVLLGAENLLSSGKVKAILVELSTRAKYQGGADYDEILSHAKSFGFTIFDLLPFYREIDMQFQPRHEGWLTEFDCILVHESFLKSKKQWLGKS